MIKDLFALVKETFHGKGYKYYRSKVAQEKFSESDKKAAELLLISPLAYIISVTWKKNPLQGWVILIVVISFFIGFIMRHCSLKIYDEINDPSNQESKA